LSKFKTSTKLVTVLIMSKGVAITGMGIISAIGNTVEENYVSLVNNKIGITTIKNISTVHSGEIKVGEIKKTNQQLIDELQLSPNNNFSRTAMKMPKLLRLTNIKRA
jgi:3-oxoacyl-(acyl-carrier-protein) synthase